MMGYYHPCMLVDPHNNLNNFEGILIDRMLYRANAALYALENKTLAESRRIAKEICR